MRSAQEKHLEQDPLRVASNVAGLLMENDRVRVIDGHLKVGDKAAMHSHPDHVVYVVKGGKAQFSYPSGKVEAINLETGKAIFMEAQSHEITNVGDNDIEFVVVELK